MVRHQETLNQLSVLQVGIVFSVFCLAITVLTRRWDALNIAIVTALALMGANYLLASSIGSFWVRMALREIATIVIVVALVKLPHRDATIATDIERQLLEKIVELSMRVERRDQQIGQLQRDIAAMRADVARLSAGQGLG